MGDRIERVIIWNLEGQILTDPRFSCASSVSTKELIQAYKDYLAYCEWYAVNPLDHVLCSRDELGVTIKSVSQRIYPQDNNS